MMALPFFTTFAAILFAARGWRIASIVTTILTIAIVLVLFRLHATDILDLDL